MSFATEGVGQWTVGSRGYQCPRARGFESRAFLTGGLGRRREEGGSFFCYLLGKGQEGFFFAWKGLPC
jgi:hypothetical protein